MLLLTGGELACRDVVGRGALDDDLRKVSEAGRQPPTTGASITPLL